MINAELSARQLKFINEYLVDGNGAADKILHLSNAG